MLALARRSASAPGAAPEETPMTTIEILAWMLDEAWQYLGGGGLDPLLALLGGR